MKLERKILLALRDLNHFTEKFESPLDKHTDSTRQAIKDYKIEFRKEVAEILREVRRLQRIPHCLVNINIDPEDPVPVGSIDELFKDLNDEV